MIFTTVKPNGETEVRQHVPYRVEKQGSSWYAYHKITGMKLARFDSEDLLRWHMDSITEPLPALHGVSNVFIDTLNKYPDKG